MNATVQDDEGEALPLAQLKQISQPTVADQVFDELHRNILSLALPPGAKISEIEVAKTMGVSRQPVREAFKRLAKLGFLLVRPQSSTTVTYISEDAVLRARYIRSALEIQTCRTAAAQISDAGLAALSALIDAQRQAIEDQDRVAFHRLDDQFHREICIQSGVHYVWDLIHESKGHMDRVRMLSLSGTSQRSALHEHTLILDAISKGDGDTCEQVIRTHLGRITNLIDTIKTENHEWFQEADL